MRILNAEKLATTPLRYAALAIADAGLVAIDTGALVRANVRFENHTLTVHGVSLPLAGRLIVIGVGKCAYEAARALEEILGDAVTDGIILAPGENLSAVSAHSRFTVFAGTHPLPSEANVGATRAIIERLRGLSPHDIVLFIISGGGSTLLCQPKALRCEEEVEVLRTLMRAGATIDEVNTLRKHLSEARGGFLAKHAHPARVLSLIFSDVPGNALEFIASGPTVKDSTTIGDARRIVERYGVTAVCGWDAALIETPKEDRYFEQVTNFLFASNDVALRAMVESARREGFEPHVVSDAFTGEAAPMGAAIAHTLHGTPAKHALLYGGETTVRALRGSGKGGRNMELALAALTELADGELVLALASDGRDNSDFAGALCDTMTREKAKQRNYDPRTFLDKHDSYHFFETTGDALVTGATGANVADLVIALKS
jgi:glycerate-2-kinase